MASEQTHCDWCYGPIDDEDRRRSSELGIDDESAWACGNCMDLRLLLDPPEWWEGDPDNWPVKDLKDQVKLAEDNVKIVLSDVDRSIGLRPRVTVDTYRTAVRSPTTTATRRRRYSPSPTRRLWLRPPITSKSMSLKTYGRRGRCALSTTWAYTPKSGITPPSGGVDSGPTWWLR
jgi:hypothetical protein